MRFRQTHIKAGCLGLVLAACGTGNKDSDDRNQEAGSPDLNIGATDENTVAAPPEDTGAVDEVAEADTGSVDEEVEDGAIRMEGPMEVEYTYDGSLGTFTATCSGDAAIAIHSNDVIDGEGTCANEIITFNFAIDGTRDGDTLSGMLVAESAFGRAETPYSGLLEDLSTELTFDHTHAADGEALRLVGIMNLEAIE